MATQCSVLAWRIPRTGEPGGLPIYEVAQSRTRLKRLSSSSSSMALSEIKTNIQKQETKDEPQTNGSYKIRKIII